MNFHRSDLTRTEREELNALSEPPAPATLPGAVSRLRRYLAAAAELAEARRGDGIESRRPELVVALAQILAADVNITPEPDRY